MAGGMYIKEKFFEFAWQLQKNLLENIYFLITLFKRKTNNFLEILIAFSTTQ